MVAREVSRLACSYGTAGVGGEKMTDLSERIGNIPANPLGDKELLVRLFRLQGELRDPPKTRECGLRFQYVWYARELGRRGYAASERVAIEWYNRRFGV